MNVQGFYFNKKGCCTSFLVNVPLLFVVIERKTANLDSKYFFRLFCTCVLTFYFNLMRILFYRLLYFLLLSNVVLAQKIEWEKSCGGKYGEYLSDVKATADYGFILVGSSLSKKSGNKNQNNNGDLDYWIWKMNESGDLDWQKNFGGSGSDFLQSIALTNDAGYILAGTSNSEKGFDKEVASKGQDDFRVIKLNATGGQEWQNHSRI